MCRNPHRRPNIVWSKRWIVCILCVALWFVFCSPPAWAHKVTIFAWVEGDTVYTQSKFSGGKRPKNSTVAVYDMEGHQLLEGKTDENGQFSFKIPKKAALKVALKASMGHLAEWTIPADEIGGVAESSEGIAPGVGDQPAIQETGHSTVAKTNAEVPVQTAVALGRQEIQELIDESLDKKLTPITNMLADSLDRGPQMSEVIGGVGYIFGLVGVALYCAARRKRK